MPAKAKKRKPAARTTSGPFWRPMQGFDRPGEQVLVVYKKFSTAENDYVYVVGVGVQECEFMFTLVDGNVARATHWMPIPKPPTQ